MPTGRQFELEISEGAQADGQEDYAQGVAFMGDCAQE